MKTIKIFTLVWAISCLIMMLYLAREGKMGFAILWGVYTIISFGLVIGYMLKGEGK
jgi:hypothetical protein